MKVSDIRDLTDAELVVRIKDEQEMLVKMRFNHSVASIENPSKIRHSKRTIARLHTILTQRSKKK